LPRVRDGLAPYNRPLVGFPREHRPLTERPRCVYPGNVQICCEISYFEFLKLLVSKDRLLSTAPAPFTRYVATNSERSRRSLAGVRFAPLDGAPAGQPGTHRRRLLPWALAVRVGRERDRPGGPVPVRRRREALSESARGCLRLYCEATPAEGAHELGTELLRLPVPTHNAVKA
jgi:hypothetical protein